MIGKTIKSMVRTKPDPAYYRKIIERLTPKRNDLLDAAEAKGDVYERDPTSDERRQADKLTHKIRWAITQMKVALNMTSKQ